jgi:hypothetical protein
MKKILATDGIDAVGKKILQDSGFTVITDKVAQDNLADYINPASSYKGSRKTSLTKSSVSENQNI